MISIVLGFYKRRADMTCGAFSTYWRDVHGPMIVGNPSVSRHMKRYVQHRPSASNTASYPVEQLGFDGFSKVWYDSAEDRGKLQAEPGFPNTIEPDETMFLDLAATRA